MAEDEPQHRVLGERRREDRPKRLDRWCRRSSRRSSRRGRCRRWSARARSPPGSRRASASGSRRSATRRSPRPSPRRGRAAQAPVSEVTAKPVTAPISIMPSTPRFSTPDFSTTSSPSAASSSGVAAPMTVIRIEIVTGVHQRGSFRAAAQAQPVADEDVGGEQEEQHHRLEDAGRRGRQPERGLRLLAADIGDREDDAGEDDADRMQPAEEGDDDRGEAVAGRELRHHLPEGAGRLEDAGEPGQPAAGEQRQPDRAVAAEAAVARRLRRRADDADLEAEGGLAPSRTRRRARSTSASGTFR